MEYSISNNIKEGKASFDFDSFSRSYVDHTKKTEITNEVNKNPDSNSGTVNTDNTGNPTQTTGQTTQQTTQVNKNIISADLALTMFDIFMSRAVTIGARFGGIVCEFKDMQLTPDERAKIKPAFDAVVDEYLKKMTPEKMLIVSLCLIYGGKIITVSMLQDTNPKVVAKKEAEKKKEENGGTKGKQGRHKLSCAKHVNKNADCNCKV